MALPLKDFVVMPVGTVETYLLPDQVSETDFLNALRTYAFRRKTIVTYKRYFCFSPDDNIVQRMVVAKIEKTGVAKRKAKL